MPLKTGMRVIIFALFLWGFLFFGFFREFLFCQVARDSGFKYFKNYSSEDYGLSLQNWCILQDKRGVIYVANQTGLLEYDGVSWRAINIPNFIVRSLAFEDSGTIYIGGINEIGFLSPARSGTRQYVSLVNHIDKSKRNFSTVLRAHAANEGIYFYTTKYLFRWNPTSKTFSVWEPKGTGVRFNASFTCNGKFFIHQRKFGLMHIEDNSLQLIPGNETFAEVKIYMMAPYDTGKLLIGTRENGLFLYDGKKTVPFHTNVDDYIKENQLYHGIRLLLSPGDFALATLRGGVVIIDSQGRLKQILDKTYGLRVNNVKYVFEDFQGNLWLAMVKGIAKIEYVSPFLIYDDQSNLPELVLSVVKHGPKNDLYAGTTSGLYVLASPYSDSFRHVPGISANCFSLLSVGDFLLAATSRGIFQVENKNETSSIRKIINIRSYFLHQSKVESSRVWVGTRQGLVSLYLSSKSENQNRKQWVKEYQFENITEEIRTIVEDKKGNLWLGPRVEGVLKVDFPLDGTVGTRKTRIIRYDTSHKLPPEEVRVFMAAGHVMFATGKGIFRFNEKTGEFLPDTTLGEEFAGGEKGRAVFRIVEDKKKNIWLHSDVRNIQAIPGPGGTYVINKKPFLKLSRTQVETIYPDPDGYITWFASHEGLIRYDTTVEKKYDIDFQTLIREVVVNGTPMMYDIREGKYKTGQDWKVDFPVIPYRDRNLRFEFSALFFEDESKIRYRYLLEGYDENWSDWGSETKIDYTNLDSGDYTFRVRAKNIYENESREAIFHFKILLPWYRTWWAYLSYAIAFLLLTYLIVKWRHAITLKLEKQKLERIVKERTKEIEEKNRQLEEQSEKLKEMDKVKSRFFANISHEFRTPLTLIMGPLEQMLSGSRESELEQKKRFKLMLRNSQRLLGLINQLLELSKLDSGEVRLQASRQNIVPFLKGIAASFEMAAAQNELDLIFHAEEENITLYFDPGKLEEAICNLISNAVKFTPAGGRISLSVKISPGSDFGEISVSDTGPGIPRDQLEHIFDRFYQADSTYEHHRKGSGIGLSITRELVELHHGTIAAHTGEGEESGTTFTIRLPLGDAHLEPEEIVDLSETAPRMQEYGRIPAAAMMEKEEEDLEPLGEDVEKESAAAEKDIILVVEDSADLRDYMRRALEPHYRVVDAADGEEGIEKAKEIIPDLIVSDIMMPKKDGYELCRNLKNDIEICHIPVILLTAKASEEDVLQGLETGADDYITKPFNTMLLMARIKNLIDLRRQLQLKLNREMTRQPVEISVSPMDNEFIKDLQEVIEKNLGDPDFNVEELCKKLYMSRPTVYRKIQALTGESPTDFIRSYRLKRAAQLLESGFGSITEVAFEVGFSSRAYFTKCFKEKFHQLPSSFLEAEFRETTNH
ncbi:MAG: response regulator [Candidatus Aminicenantes bacterium]|nr:response regulator [Candidatus Aminicenantes bacterium]NIM81733.1 response regulator [Candidatus Aminicenantes bacterium]NIN21104.1 response regulator [Candidatus Aminicenantes bacterium]NIN44926.1 response regulator [Candidatus Aminicenantes bacterium]NIN87740.1 response regulator [Candidatus Aminicenantes bacterium]